MGAAATSGSFRPAVPLTCRLSGIPASPAATEICGEFLYRYVVATVFSFIGWRYAQYVKCDQLDAQFLTMLVLLSFAPATNFCVTGLNRSYIYTKLCCDALNLRELVKPWRLRTPTCTFAIK